MVEAEEFLDLRRTSVAILVIWVFVFCFDQVTSIIDGGIYAFFHGSGLANSTMLWNISRTLVLISLFAAGVIGCLWWYFLKARRGAFQGAVFGLLLVAILFVANTFLDNLYLPFVSVKPSFTPETFDPIIAVGTVVICAVCGWVAHRISQNDLDRAVPILVKPQG
jgi:hypothetical protein